MKKYYNAKYSIIKYCDEIMEEDIEEVLYYLSNGIIIHLFSKGNFKEELELNGYLEEEFLYARKNGFLYIYEEQNNIYDDNIIIAVDGQVLEKHIYINICDDKENGFNHEQYNIVTATTDSNIIVVSGAGTGKTTTMINRLIYLKKTQSTFNFEKSALITFTNKASKSMREKLITVLEKYYKLTKNPEYLNMMDEASRAVISTIHGFSKKLINEFGKSINFNKNIQVKSFKYYRKKAIIESLNYVYKNYKDLYSIIKYYPLYDVENKMLSIWEKLDNYSIDVNSSQYSIKFGQDKKDFSRLVEIVIKKAQEHLETYKDYEIEIVDLIKKLSYKDLFYAAKGKYDLIMVDEFQDSDNIQIDFVANFCYITGAKLLVVGDEKQSIYRFRGAEYTSFYRLRKIMAQYSMYVKEFTMVRNYRTDSKLLEQINNIFISIDKKVDKFNYKENDYIYSLVNENENSKIEYISLNEEGIEIEKFYINLLNNKNDDEYISVLLRSNSDLKKFKRFCDVRGIPCRVDVSGSFYRHEAVRDFYIMIKALIDTDLNNVMYSFIETPYISSMIDKKIILCSDTEIINEYLKEILSKNNWSDYSGRVNEINILELIDRVIDGLNPVKNYYKRELLKLKVNNKNYKKIAYAKTLEYKINLEHLLYLIRDNFADNISSVYAIENFLRLKISTDNIVDVRRPEDRIETQFLQCSTVHKAKGLEYDYVIMPKLSNPFITGKDVEVVLRNNQNTVNVGFKVILADDEYKNSFYSDYLKDEKSEIIGEESRLLYVAMTRCKKKLYLNADGVIASEGQNSWNNLIGGAKSYV